MKILDHTISFPHPETAHDSGILAIGGDLSTKRLLLAYQYGIFPWYNEGEPIVWWHPDPRFVLFPTEVKIAKSMRAYFNQGRYTVTFDQQFDTVIRKCGTARDRKYEGTWISEEIVESYSYLHEIGYAHSVEVWEGDRLVGGLYGIAIGKVFYGESMYSDAPNASKVALITLARTLERRGYVLIDCQIANPHLESMGGRHIPRRAFLAYMSENVLRPADNGKWTNEAFDIDIKTIL